MGLHVLYYSWSLSPFRECFSVFIKGYKDCSLTDTKELFSCGRDAYHGGLDKGWNEQSLPRLLWQPRCSILLQVSIHRRLFFFNLLFFPSLSLPLAASCLFYFIAFVRLRHNPCRSHSCTTERQDNPSCQCHYSHYWCHPFALLPKGSAHHLQNKHEICQGSNKETSNRTSAPCTLVLSLDGIVGKGVGMPEDGGWRGSVSDLSQEEIYVLGHNTQINGEELILEVNLV